MRLKGSVRVFVANGRLSGFIITFLSKEERASKRASFLLIKVKAIK